MNQWMFYTILTMLVFSACKKDEQKVYVYDERGALSEEYTIDPVDSTRHGIYHRYYENGNKFETAHYDHGVLHGLRTIFYESGPVEIEERYKHGTFVGTFKSYYENGQIDVVGEYEDGVMTGIWKRYYDTGELMEEVTMANNDENGPFTEYFKNGNLKAEGHYKDGDNEHGLLKLYNETGQLIRKMECNVGVCHTIWKLENDEATGH